MIVLVFTSRTAVFWSRDLKPWGHVILVLDLAQVQCSCLSLFSPISFSGQGFHSRGHIIWAIMVVSYIVARGHSCLNHQYQAKISRKDVVENI